MVRINLIKPKQLADQHLIAEYNETLMLLGYVKKHPDVNEIPEEYKLGPGHIKFFKNKLVYLKNRHEEIKKEMHNRGFQTTKTINLNDYNKELHNNWKPKQKDFKIIKERLTWKIKQKPNYYRYYSENKSQKFLIDLLKS